MVCPHCGSTPPEGALFCNTCGWPLRELPPFCRRCGWQVLIYLQNRKGVCNRCGHIFRFTSEGGRLTIMG